MSFAVGAFSGGARGAGGGGGGSSESKRQRQQRDAKNRQDQNAPHVRNVSPLEGFRNKEAGNLTNSHIVSRRSSYQQKMDYGISLRNQTIVIQTAY